MATLAVVIQAPREPVSLDDQELGKILTRPLSIGQTLDGQILISITVPLVVSSGDGDGMLGLSSGADASSGTSQRFALEGVS